MFVPPKSTPITIILKFKEELLSNYTGYYGIPYANLTCKYKKSVDKCVAKSSICVKE
jgi:hypothetical protein